MRIKMLLLVWLGEYKAIDEAITVEAQALNLTVVREKVLMEHVLLFLTIVV